MGHLYVVETARPLGQQPLRSVLEATRMYIFSVGMIFAVGPAIPNMQLIDSC